MIALQTQEPGLNLLRGYFLPIFYPVIPSHQRLSPTNLRVVVPRWACEPRMRRREQMRKNSLSSWPLHGARPPASRSPSRPSLQHRARQIHTSISKVLVHTILLLLFFTKMFHEKFKISMTSRSYIKIKSFSS